jgi:adenine-specific DNA-methyltransferase
VTAAIDALLNRIGDERLADQIRATLTQERSREFGLVFEHHLPETVELPGMVIRPGVKVRMLPRRNSTEKVEPGIWLVAKINDQVADLVSLDGDQTAVRSAFDLVRVADFADPIYPGLEVTETCASGKPDDPWHVLIDAENYHALLALQFTHAGLIDTLYLDPPYNTGGDDWIYSDRHVASEDGFRHSKWLSFMERRLQLAKKLLKRSGVIIVAIGDDEHHRLRMLMDQAFGEQNFIADATWQGGTKNDAKFLGGGVDYMLIYASDKAFLQTSGTRWRETKGDFQALIDAGRRLWGEASGDYDTAVKLLAEWRAENKGILSASVIEKARFDRDGSLFKATDLSWPGGGGPRFDVLHPITGKPVQVPRRGWGATPEAIQEMIAQGRIIFGADHTSSARVKTPIEQTDLEVVKPSFYKDRRTSAQRLEKVLGDKRFPFPKDHEVLMRWIGLVTPPDGTVLDFFGGSGSTLEAVLRLNAQDGGTRQCILVTNNEVGSRREMALRKAGHRDGDPEWEAAGVCEYVTKPRIRTILTGIRPDGSPWADTVAGNIQFATLTYEDPALIELDMAFARIAPLLWLMAGARGYGIDAIPDTGWAMSRSYGVLFNLDRHEPFLEALTDQKIAFIVTDDEGQFQRVAAEIPPKCRAVRLYESYLRSFQLQNEGV